LRVLTLCFAAFLLSGCAGWGEPVLDADGCRPAMAIYQPPVRLGGTGSILHIPRACPAKPAPVTPSGTEASPDRPQPA